MAAISRVNEIWKAPTEEEGAAFEFREMTDCFATVDSLSFSYKNRAPVLDNLSLKVKEGAINLLTGPNGSGKSTLFKLLLGLYPPEKGRITYNMPPPDKEQSALTYVRENIAYAEQSPLLFKGTVLDNLMAAQRKKTEREVCLWLRSSPVWSVLENFPDQENSHIEEGGTNLSGGQRACIAVARAMLKETKFLLLDEPSANLDESTRELIVQMVYHYVKNGNTALVITHDQALFHAENAVKVTL